MNQLVRCARGQRQRLVPICTDPPPKSLNTRRTFAMSWTLPVLRLNGVHVM